MVRGSQAYSVDGMQGITIAILLTIFALMVIPLTIGYYLWLARTVLPRVAALPPRVAIVVWWFQR